MEERYSCSMLTFHVTYSN